METACFDYVRSASEDPTSVPDEILQRLKQHLTPPQIVELACVVGFLEVLQHRPRQPAHSGGV